MSELNIPITPVTRHPSRERRVLVVDDEEAVRTFVARTLTRAGFQTYLATGGREAIEVASATGPFDLIITDLVMPEMAGNQVVRTLRKRWPDLKVLYLTGYGDRLMDDPVALEGNEAFLDKPCSGRSLLDAIALVT
jgi:two-component system cell cycle sensor histidine kinase/response regulator CckA